MTNAPTLFSATLANRTLPLVRRITADLRDVFQELARLRILADDDPLVGRRRVLETRLRECTAELEQIGCQFKGFHDGHALVDFPGRLEGRAICLCWRGDEPTVAHYHGLDEGFAGRRPLPDHALEA